MWSLQPPRGDPPSLRTNICENISQTFKEDGIFENSQIYSRGTYYTILISLNADPDIFISFIFRI